SMANAQRRRLRRRSLQRNPLDPICAFDLEMPGKRATSWRQPRGHSAMAQFGPESQGHRWVGPLSRCNFGPTRLARASLPERPAGLNGGFPTNVVNTPIMPETRHRYEYHSVTTTGEISQAKLADLASRGWERFHAERLPGGEFETSFRRV